MNIQLIHGGEQAPEGSFPILEKPFVKSTEIAPYRPQPELSPLKQRRFTVHLDRGWTSYTAWHHEKYVGLHR